MPNNVALAVSNPMMHYTALPTHPLLPSPALPSKPTTARTRPCRPNTLLSETAMPNDVALAETNPMMMHCTALPTHPLLYPTPSCITNPLLNCTVLQAQIHRMQLQCAMDY